MLDQIAVGIPLKYAVSDVLNDDSQAGDFFLWQNDYFIADWAETMYKRRNHKDMHTVGDWTDEGAYVRIYGSELSQLEEDSRIFKFKDKKQDEDIMFFVTLAREAIMDGYAVYYTYST